MEANYKYIVTLKYPEVNHDRRNKKVGPCHVSPFCTDSTGGHHCILVEARSVDCVEKIVAKLGVHVTRIELVDKIYK